MLRFDVKFGLLQKYMGTMQKNAISHKIQVLISQQAFDQFKIGFLHFHRHVI